LVFKNHSVCLVQASSVIFQHTGHLDPLALEVFTIISLFSSKFLNINLIWNEGIAFGLFSFGQNNLYNFLTVFIVGVIFLVFIMMIKANGVKRYALLMIFAGAIGNVYDRIVFKSVPDFIDFHIGEFHWFIFNVADIFITLGVFFMIIFELTSNKKYEQL